MSMFKITKDALHSTPLHLAFFKGQLDIVNFMETMEKYLSLTYHGL